MKEIEQLLSDIIIPPLVRVRQQFPRAILNDVAAAVRNELNKPGLLDRVRPGDSVAVTAGSRGIANLALILREIAGLLKQAGASPFIVPAMGSHGGATADGQIDVLAGLGITPESVGMPIRASMEVVDLANVGEQPAYFAQTAFAADHVIAVGRIKPHTSFRGAYESGIAKMIAIGLGKQRGADLCHQLGLARMSERIEKIARIAIEKTNILGGVAILENAYDETCRIVALSAGEILAAEPALLAEAKSFMPRVYLNHSDVLIVDEIGKNISGTGMDPNIIERYTTPLLPDTDKFQRIAVLDLSRASKGNFYGLGLADTCTRRLYERINFAETYPNSLTSRVIRSVTIPMVLDNDRQAIQSAIQTCVNLDPRNVRMIRIKNTLQLEEIWISPALMAEAIHHPNLEVMGEPAPLLFDQDGNIVK